MSQQDEIIVVQATERALDGKHGFRRGWGITGSTVGSLNLSMGHGVLPPKTKATPHYHAFETAIFIISGSVRVFYGKEINKYIDVSAGDFLYIPPFVIHSPENLSELPMEYVTARNAPEDIAEEVTQLTMEILQKA